HQFVLLAPVCSSNTGDSHSSIYLLCIVAAAGCHASVCYLYLCSEQAVACVDATLFFRPSRRRFARRAVGGLVPRLDAAGTRSLLKASLLTVRSVGRLAERESPSSPASSALAPVQ